MPDAGDAHSGVAALVARAISMDGAFRARFIGRHQTWRSAADSTLLYTSGNREFAPSAGIINWLEPFIDGGGTPVGDGCHAAPADPFGSAFDKLARAVNQQMKRVRRR